MARHCYSRALAIGGDTDNETDPLCFPDFDSCGTLNARGPVGTVIGDFYGNF